MSKINPAQAAALKETPSKATAAKTVPKTAVKSTTAKPAVTRSASAPRAKSVTSKPAAIETATKNVPAASVLKNDDRKNAKAKVTKEKTPKLKMERDSFTMPKTEYAQFSILKERLTKLGQPAKKSELLRAGLMLLSNMTDTALKTALTKVPAIKTGRPKKK